MGKEKFNLPKLLVCHYSTYFDSKFEEGIEQELLPEDVSTTTFGLVVQWMYANKLVLPPLPDSLAPNGSQKLTLLLDFVKFSDEVDLLGPFTSATAQIKEILVASHESLLPEHVRSGVKLPSGHPVRKLFAQSCIPAYVHYIQPPIPRKDGRDVYQEVRKNTQKFRFRKELDDLHEFSKDLYAEYEEVMRSRQLRNPYTLRNPLTGTDFHAV